MTRFLIERWTLNVPLRYGETSERLPRRSFRRRRVGRFSDVQKIDICSDLRAPARARNRARFLRARATKIGTSETDN